MPNTAIFPILDTKFHLATGELNLAQFRVLQSFNLFRNNLAIEIGLLENHHFVRFKDKEIVLSEVCSHRELVQIPDNMVISETLEEIGDRIFSTILSSRKYEFTTYTKNWDEGLDLLKILRSKTNDSNIYKLSRRFLGPEYVDREAVTELYLTTDDVLLIETVQTYPNKGCMVFTRSTLSPSGSDIHE